MQTRFFIITVFLGSVVLIASSVYAALYGPPSTGVERLKLKDGEIVIKINRSRQCMKDANDGKDVLCFPNSIMTLTKKGKVYDLTKIIERWNEFYIFFVKIRKNKYLADLNNDKRDEIAILPMLSGGGEHVSDAYIYTVMDDGLKFFGKGRFFWEFGDYVKFGCPKCWKFDLKSCEVCY